jgi:hypothetical protein
MKSALPENAKIAKEAKECMQECVSEFISFITSEGLAHPTIADGLQRQLRGLLSPLVQSASLRGRLSAAVASLERTVVVVNCRQ